MRTRRIAVWAGVGLAVMLMAGCRVESDKHGNGDNVTISTPFGGMHVKTNDAVTPESIGVAAYPGASMVKKDNDNGSADVDMSFGGFQLRVKAADYRTGDAPDKVEAFYRTEMKRYGDVIACRDHSSVGTPTHTLEGLGCDEKHSSGYSNHAGSGELQLKAGSEQHQHIVSIESDGGGTKFGLVALDLPGKNGHED